MKNSDKLRKKIQAAGERTSDELRRFKDLAYNLLKGGLTLIASLKDWSYYQLVIAPYFHIWSYKSQIRNKLRYTALAMVSFSTLTLTFEIFLELVGHERLLHFFTLVTDARVVEGIEKFRSFWPVALFLLPNALHWIKIGLVVLLVASVAYLTWHNAEEARKPSYEYHFARAINSFLLDCRIAHASNKPLSVLDALKFCHFIFMHAKVQHVCLHLAENGVLSIRTNHIYPPDEKLSAVRLQPGEGVAGEVYNDEKLHLQYVPRLFFPFNRHYGGWLFPHAVRFQFSQQSVPGTDLKLWQIGDEEINPDVFKRGEGPIPYHSFLSVPVFSVSDKSLLGVLSLDFSKTDALDKADIAMALVFVLILAGEIRGNNITL